MSGPEAQIRQIIQEFLATGTKPQGPFFPNGRTNIPNRLLTDNQIPDQVIRTYGTVLRLLPTTEAEPDLEARALAIAMALALQSPKVVYPNHRQPRRACLPKIEGGRVTNILQEFDLAARDGPTDLSGATAIPNQVLTDPRLSDRAVRVYGILMLQADEDHLVLSPQSHLLWVLGDKSERTLQYSVTELERAGYITRLKQPRANVPSIYRLEVE